eukprot:TRINITY_DN4070_c2_g1_i1.p1 TRINITY_DN4070_c2_g1~~TRINITY_DN4070_c2_g1_i1.p1  ORF type:complete len:131 (-),score=36.93 TRINITY_DN4070_c2_g1_i1:47-439(-)
MSNPPSRPTFVPSTSTSTSSPLVPSAKTSISFDVQKWEKLSKLNPAQNEMISIISESTTDRPLPLSSSYVDDDDVIDKSEHNVLKSEENEISSTDENKQKPTIISDAYQFSTWISVIHSQHFPSSPFLQI